MAEPMVEVLDRRARRRQASIEEALGHALDVMAEQGVAGLSLGEVARRMGIRTPSIYVYFDSKNAMYDAIFARGWRLLDDAVAAGLDEARRQPDLRSRFLHRARVFVEWAISNPAYAQLMFWRPVPGWTPSADAYQAAVDLAERNRDEMRTLQAQGLLRQDVDAEDLFLAWTVFASGVVSQQLSNAPGASFDDGPYTTLLPQLVEMYVSLYATSAGRRRARTRRSS
ncbi:MAG TPA: TetR/AcrR family transcriptional regulator [Mycobacteriales bacterium]|nr:TetR/AcrR family transcriptional regulator [Mycobacteriales bacterium]